MHTKGRYLFFIGAATLMIVLCELLPQSAFCQPYKEDLPTRRLLLQLASCFLNVARENQIDIDSGLVLASQRMRVNPMIVIDEGGDNGPTNPSVNPEDLAALKASLSAGSGADYIRRLNRIGAAYAFRPGARASDLDSALSYLNQAKTGGTVYPGLVSRTYSLIGKSWLEKGDTVRAGMAFRTATSLAIHAGDKHAEALAWSWWGEYAAFQPQTIQERIARLKIADSLFKISGDRRDRINTLSNVGYLSVAAGRIADSKRAFMDALQLEDSIHFLYKHYTLDTRCLLAIFEGDLPKIQQYAMEETKAAESTGDSTALAYVYARRLNAEMADNADSGASALDWGFKSLREFRRWREELLSYRVALNIGFILITKGRNNEAVSLLEGLVKRSPPITLRDKYEVYTMLGHVYVDLGRLDNAERYLLPAEQLHKQVSLSNGDLEAGHFYILLGRLYLAKKQFEKSRRFLNTALSYPNSSEREWADVHQYLATIDSATGQLKDAYIQMRLYSRMMDTVFTRSNLRLVNEMRTKYETEKKDNNIKLLQEQAALQDSRNRQNVLTRNVFIGGASVLLIFLLLLYNRFRLKQRTNRALEVQKAMIIEKNGVLHRLVEEKEWLLKEVHHRVKNNLHTVICLLESQARHLENDALKAIEISQHRIYAMSLIHQKLYQSSDLKAIDMAVYLPEFIQYLRKSFDNAGQIDFTLDVEPVVLDVAQAVPVALIINESVTNSIKYAFPNNREGTIEIAMWRSEHDINLRICDNGIGIPKTIVDKPVGSLGLKLIRGLSEDIGTGVKIENENGTVIELQFQANLLNTSRSGAEFTDERVTEV